jgi:hypothetical protein
MAQTTDSTSAAALLARRTLAVLLVIVATALVAFDAGVIPAMLGTVLILGAILAAGHRRGRVSTRPLT